MTLKAEQQQFFKFARKFGYAVDQQMADNVEIERQKVFDFLPELVMFVASYVVVNDFTRQTTPNHIKDSICFFFHNVFEDDTPAGKKRRGKTQEETPHVRAFPAALPQRALFKKNTHVKIVSVIISAEYLKSFLKQDAKQFSFLFDSSNNFLIEEIMTDDIIRTVNAIVKKEKPATLSSYYYKLKAMELLFYLFRSLGKRETAVHQKLSDKDIRSVYKVRDKLVSSLHKPSTIAALKQVAGMNELKMRRIFIQVFGMGIYDYYQHMRMKEAARLLQDEKLSVSEAGYQMGFENLGHFTRVFEKHMGKKPKKYSKELA